MPRRRGLTLIEMLVAMTILGMVTSGLYASFSSGMQIFRRAEAGLDRNMTLRMFLTFLKRDLEQMVTYTPVPFSGKEREMEFPARVKTYKEKGAIEGLYTVRYKYESNRLTREEESIRKRTGGGREKRKAVMLEGVRKFEVAYAYKDPETTGILWRDLWDPEDSLGLPQGLRVRMQVLSDANQNENQIKISGQQKKSEPPVLFETYLWIPEGAWGTLK